MRDPEWPHILFYMACHLVFIMCIWIHTVSKRNSWQCANIEDRLKSLQQQLWSLERSQLNDVSELIRIVFQPKREMP